MVFNYKTDVKIMMSGIDFSGDIIQDRWLGKEIKAVKSKKGK